MNHIEYCLVSVNPATLFANNLYLAFRRNRENQERFKSHYKCATCKRHGDNTLHKQETMYHILKKRRKGDREVLYWDHYCGKDGEVYSPYKDNIAEIVKPIWQKA